MDLAPEFYTRLQEAVRLHAPSMSMELLERAYYFAARMHHGCFRKDKVSLYIIHPTPLSRPCSTTRWRTPPVPTRACAVSSARRWPTWSRASPSSPA